MLVIVKLQWNPSTLRWLLQCASLLGYTHRKSRWLGSNGARLCREICKCSAACKELKRDSVEVFPFFFFKKKETYSFYLEISLRTTSVLQNTTHRLTHRYMKPHMLLYICSSINHTRRISIKYASLILWWQSSCHNKFLKMNICIKSCSGLAYSYCSDWCKKVSLPDPTPRKKKDL